MYVYCYYKLDPLSYVPLCSSMLVCSYAEVKRYENTRVANNSTYWYVRYC